MLAEWLEEHPDLRSLVVISITGRSKDRSDKVDARNKASHDRLIAKLQRLSAQIKKKRQAKLDKLSKIILFTVERQKPSTWSDSSKSLEARKFFFVGCTIHGLEVKLVNFDIEEMGKRIVAARSFMEMLDTPGFVPEGRLVEVVDEFFNIKVKSDERARIKTELIRLRGYHRLLWDKIRKYKVPRVFSSYENAINHVISLAKVNVDLVTSCTPIVQEEVDLSRLIWNCDEGARVRKIIDELVDSVVIDETEEFAKKVVQVCLSLIPSGESRGIDERITGLVIIFRCIFDRMYTKCPTTMFPDKLDNAAKLDELCRRTVKAFGLPPALNFDESQSIGDCVKGDKGLLDVADFLNQILFMTNPIDILCFVHQAIVKLQEAVCEKVEELLLSFDDLFSLLVGISLSSDVWGFGHTASFLSHFSPTFCLSNTCEYAQATVLSVAAHCDDSV